MSDRFNPHDINGAYQNDESKAHQNADVRYYNKPAEPQEPRIPDPRTHYVYSYNQPTNEPLRHEPPKKKKKGNGVAITTIIAGFACLAIIGSTAVNSLINGMNLGGKSNTELEQVQEAAPKDIESDTPSLNIITNADEQKPTKTVAPQGAELTTAEIARKVKPSVVGIVSVTQNAFGSSNEGVGSGIIMSEDGYIITNNHVISDSKSIEVVLSNNERYPATIIGRDEQTDLAVIKIEAAGLTTAEFGDSDQLEDGDVAVAIGNPGGLELQGTVTQGVISAINRDLVVDDRTMTLIQTDASINPGNSGGPLVNKYGQVVGINTVKISSSYYEGLGFAIPVNVAQPIINELIEKGYVSGRPVIGISGRLVNEAVAQYNNVPMGIYVDSVDPNSDAAKKGLTAGDIIIALDGESITDEAGLNTFKSNHSAGDYVTATVYRGGQTIDITFMLMDEGAANALNP